MSSQADWINAVASAGAKDFNDELTIILTGIDRYIGALPADAPNRPLLFEIREAAERCAEKSSSLLNFTQRRGAHPSVGRMENLFNGC
jgi:hypothetical protein